MEMPASLSILAPLLAAEQTASCQYQAESSLYALWGLSKLSAHLEQESLEERQHLRILTDRLLFLEGEYPTLEYVSPTLAAEVEPILRHDLATELNAVASYTKAITALEKVEDYESRRLIQKILKDEQKHANWLEMQLSLMGRMGLQNWLALWV